MLSGIRAKRPRLFRSTVRTGAKDGDGGWDWDVSGRVAKPVIAPELSRRLGTGVLWPEARNVCTRQTGRTLALCPSAIPETGSQMQLDIASRDIHLPVRRIDTGMSPDGGLMAGSPEQLAFFRSKTFSYCFRLLIPCLCTALTLLLRQTMRCEINICSHPLTMSLDLLFQSKASAGFPSGTWKVSAERDGTMLASYRRLRGRNLLKQITARPAGNTTSTIVAATPDRPTNA